MRYSKFKYGAGVLYGTSPTVTGLLWTVIIAWDGSYNGDNEALRAMDLVIRRGRDNFIQPNGGGIERYKPGVCEVVLDNSDGRYDPFNTSSPLYPNVAPGKFARILVKNGNTGTEWSLMRGMVTNIQPLDQGKQRTTRITISDGLQFLADATTQVELTTNNTWGELVEKVIRGAGTPLTEWDILINHNGNTLPYFWAMSENALETIRDLEDVELGAVIHTRTGGFRWISSNTAALSTISITADDILVDVSVLMPWEITRNLISVPYRPYVRINNDTIVYELKEPIAIAAGQSIALRVLFTRNGTPVAGEGRVLTSAVTVNSDGTGGAVPHTATFGTHWGIGTDITITNNGTTGGYITTLRVNADTTVADYEQIIVREDATSQARYGKKQLTITSPWAQRELVARTNAEALLAELKDPRIVPAIQLMHQPDLQFPIDLNNRTLIDLNIPAMNVNDTYRVGSIEHRWIRPHGGQAVLTTVQLEPDFASF
jgi:hypothetical protein